MKQQALNILITKKADEDEKAIYKYISRKFGKIYAERIRSKLIELFTKLSVTPTAGRIAKNDHSLRVFIFYRQNKIIYKRTETDVVIIRILSAKRKSAGKY